MQMNVIMSETHVQTEVCDCDIVSTDLIGERSDPTLGIKCGIFPYMCIIIYNTSNGQRTNIPQCLRDTKYALKCTKY
jgi:hypothetical protein